MLQFVITTINGHRGLGYFGRAVFPVVVSVVVKEINAPSFRAPFRAAAAPQR